MKTEERGSCEVVSSWEGGWWSEDIQEGGGVARGHTWALGPESTSRAPAVVVKLLRLHSAAGEGGWAGRECAESCDPLELWVCKVSAAHGGGS